MKKKGRKRSQGQPAARGTGPALRERYVYPVLLVVGMLLYSQVIVSGPFLFDDEHFLEKNRYVHSLANIKEIFTRSTTDGAYIKGNFYRPMQSLLHALVYAVFGLREWAHHLVSVLLHVANSCLLYRFLRMLGVRPWSSLAAVSLFLVHPVQVEAVAYISGASDPLCLLFILCGFMAYMTGIRDNRNSLLAVSILSFTAALFTKETASIVVALLLLHAAVHWNTYGRSARRKAVVMCCLVGTLCVGYVALRFTVLNFTGNFGLTGADNIYTRSLTVRMVTFVHSLADYTRLLFAPFHLYFEKPYMAYLDLFDLKALAGLVVICLALVTSFRSLGGGKMTAYGWGWAYICLLPVSGIVPVNAMYLDHWLYLPFAGLALLAALFFTWLSEKISWDNAVLGLVVILVVLGVRTSLRAGDWSDIVRFYEHELRYNETSARMHNNLAMELENHDRADEAVAHYKRAVELNDIYPQTHHNLAQIYTRQGRVDLSLRELYRALELDPAFIYSYRTLASISRSLKKERIAKECDRIIQRLEQGSSVSSDEVNTLFSGFNIH